MDPRKSVDSRATALMVLICGIWGMQQIAMKLAAPDIPPAFQVVIRSFFASLLVIALIRIKGGKLFPQGTFLPGILAGFLYATEFLCVSEGLNHTSASRMVVFMYTAPVFAALGLHFKLPEERLHRTQWVGIIIAFSGIICAFYGHSPDLGGERYPNMLLGDALGIVGGLFWGMTTIVLRTTSLAYAPPANTLLYQLGMACLLPLPVAILSGQATVSLTPMAIGSMTFQITIVAFLSFLLWMWLLRNYLASPLGVLSFMTPLFGVIFGVLFLKEPLEAGFVIGSLLVLLGIIIVSGYRWFAHIRLRHGTYGKSGS